MPRLPKKPIRKIKVKPEEPATSRLPADDVVAALKDIATAIREGHKLLAKLTLPAEPKDDRTLPLPGIEVAVKHLDIKEEEKPVRRGRPPKDPCPSCGAPSKSQGNGLFTCKAGHTFRPGGEVVAVEEPKVEVVSVSTSALPAPEPITIEALRALAMTYIGKHGKEGLAKLLAERGSATLSGVPEEARAGLAEALRV